MAAAATPDDEMFHEIVPPFTLMRLMQRASRMEPYAEQVWENTS